MQVNITQRIIYVFFFFSKRKLCFIHEKFFYKRTGYFGSKRKETVAMGAIHVAINRGKNVSQNIRLYRDNGLSVLRNASGPR